MGKKQPRPMGKFPKGGVVEVEIELGNHYFVFCF